MPKNGYHVNDRNETQPCNATKRPCKFGGEDGHQNHFASRTEAEAFAEKKVAAEFKQQEARLKKDKKLQQLLASAIDFDTVKLDDLDVTTRADLLTFEMLKRDGELQFGRIVDEFEARKSDDYKYASSYYGLQPVTSTTEEQQLKNMLKLDPVKAPYGKPDLNALVEGGYKVNYLPNTSEVDYDAEFNGTYAPSRTRAFLHTKAVLVSPSGHKAVMNVTGPAEMTNNQLSKMMKLAEEKNGGSMKSDDMMVLSDLKERQLRIDGNMDEYDERYNSSYNDYYDDSLDDDDD